MWLRFNNENYLDFKKGNIVWLEDDDAANKLIKDKKIGASELLSSDGQEYDIAPPEVKDPYSKNKDKDWKERKKALKDQGYIEEVEQ